MNNETYTSIPLGGITRNTPFFNSPDGDMAEAINLRYRHGKVYPVGAPVERTVLQGLDLLYLHKTDQYENAIVYESGGIYAYPITQSDGTETIGTCLSIVNDITKDNINGFSHIGNILICSIKNKPIVNALYNTKEQKYTVIVLPEKINLEAYSQDILSSVNKEDISLSDYDKIHPIRVASLEEIGSSSNDGNLGAIGLCTPYCSSQGNYQDAAYAIYELMNNARKNGALFNPVFLRCAIKLYDGSYVSASEPILIMSSAGYRIAARKKFDHSRYGGTNIRYSTTLLAYDIKFSISNIPANLEDIVDGVSIFISEINMFPDTDTPTTGEAILGFNDDLETTHEYLMYFAEKENSITTSSIATNISAQSLFDFKKEIFIDRLKDSAVYYEAMFIPFKELTTNEITLKIKNPGNISSNNILSAQPSYFKFESGQIFTYNQQLHMYGCKTLTQNPNKPSQFFILQNTFNLYNSQNVLLKEGIINKYQDRTPINVSSAVILIYTQQSTIKKTITNQNISIQGISPYLSTDINNAKKIVIAYAYFKDIPTTLLYKKVEVDLQPSYVDDISYYINYDLLPLTGEDISNKEFDDLYDTEEIKNEDDGNNTLRVSETSNPFIFPVEKTYTLGQGQILGLAVATQPISQGQFGQYPLYAFCSDGIWALQVGNADTSYSVQAPVSFDVCNNARSITPVLGGIIFSTASGLKLLSGGQATRIDEPLDGATINAGQYPALTTLISTLYNIPGITDNTLFTTYLAEADITYNYREDELIIFNPRYPYTYVLSGGRWSKRAGQIQSAINNYPQVFLQKDNRWYDLTRESTTLQPMFLLTRPCKFGTTHYKRIGRSILRAYAHQAHINLLLLGSNDGTTFALVNKITTGARNRTDIHLGRGIKSYKYYTYAIAIESQDESVLTCELGGIDLAFTQALNGFIR